VFHKYMCGRQTGSIIITSPFSRSKVLERNLARREKEFCAGIYLILGWQSAEISADLRNLCMTKSLKRLAGKKTGIPDGKRRATPFL